MKRLNTFALAGLALLPAHAWSIEAADIDVYGLNFTPTLKLSESYDDNIRALDGDGKKSSWVTRIAPNFELKAEDRNSAYRLTWAPTRSIYHDDSDASNTSNDIKLESIMEFDARNRLRADARYNTYENTSSTAVDGVNDEFNNTSVGGVYTYGVEDALNNLEFGARYSQLRTDNSGGINADKERNTTELYGIWYHRLGAKTQALLEYDHSIFDYELSNSIRNSTADAVLAGAVWKASAQTSGRVRVGYQRKNFDDSSVKDLNSPMWQADIAWAPRTYSTFSLTGKQSFDEGDDGSTAVKTTSTAVKWEHSWAERFTTETSVGLSRGDYEGYDRTDDARFARLGAVYSMRRWLDFELAYSYRKNDSTLDSESYTRNIYTLSVTAGL